MTMKIVTLDLIKSRPLRVQFKDLSHKRSVLVKAKKLRESSSSTFKEILTSLLKKGRLKES